MLVKYEIYRPEKNNFALLLSIHNIVDMNGCTVNLSDASQMQFDSDRNQWNLFMVRVNIFSRHLIHIHSIITWCYQFAICLAACTRMAYTFFYLFIYTRWRRPFASFRMLKLNESSWWNTHHHVWCKHLNDVDLLIHILFLCQYNGISSLSFYNSPIYCWRITTE